MVTGGLSSASQFPKLSLDHRQSGVCKPSVYTKPKVCIVKARVVGLLFLFYWYSLIVLRIFMLQRPFSKKKNVASPKKADVILRLTYPDLQLRAKGEGELFSLPFRPLFLLRFLLFSPKIRAWSGGWLSSCFCYACMFLP